MLRGAIEDIQHLGRLNVFGSSLFDFWSYSVIFQLEVSFQKKLDMCWPRCRAVYGGLALWVVWFVQWELRYCYHCRDWALCGLGGNLRVSRINFPILVSLIWLVS